MSTQKKVIDFISKAKLFTVVSTVLVLGSFAVLFTKGLNYGIDFAGGTEVQVKFDQEIEVGELRKFTESIGLDQAQVQRFGEEKEFLIRFQTETIKNKKEMNKRLNAMIEKVTTGIKTNYTDRGAVIRRVDSVGPQIGEQLKTNGLLAVIYSLVLISLYVGLRFDYEFAPGAVLCLFHDAMITLGIFSVLGKEVNIQILAAILTIIGYSLNDTIVNYDRIRENKLRLKGKSLKEIINTSINETLSRTILTSITTLIAVMALYFFAGGVISDFAFTLGIGIVVGTYSSIYVASPLVLSLGRIKAKNASA